MVSDALLTPFYRPAGRSAKETADRFWYGSAWIVAVAAVVFVSWMFEWEYYGMVAVIAAASLMLIFKDDILPLLPVVLVICFIFPKNVDPVAYYGAPAFLAFLPLTVAILIHIVRFRRRIRFGKQFLPQLAVSIALALGGLGTATAEEYTRGLTYILLLGLLILVLYFLFYQYVNPPKELDLRRYVAFALVVMGLVLVAQYVVFYYRNPKLLQAVGNPTDLGWGISNNVATLLLLSIPACFYLAVKSKIGVGYLLCAVLQYVALLLTWSRGGILVGVVLLSVLLIYGIKAADHSRWFGVSLLLVVAAVVAVLAALWEQVFPVLEKALHQGTGDAGRIDLYKEAIECFRSNIWFGAGVGFIGEHFAMTNMPMYWFHSTAFQIIADMGLVGVAAYLFFYLVRYFGVLLRRDKFNIAILLGVLGFDAYSMIDTGTFVPVPTMLIVMLITMTAELANKQDRDSEIIIKDTRNRSLSRYSAMQDRPLRFWEK